MIIRVRRSPSLEAKVKIMSGIAGYTPAEAMGRLIDLWAQCLEERTETLAAKYIRAHLGPHGVEALIEAELGETKGDWVRVRGAQDEIDTLERRVGAARKAGEASGRHRAVVGKGPGCANDSEPERTLGQRDVDESERHVNATSTSGQRLLNVFERANPDLISDLRSDSSPPEPSSETPRDLKQQGRGQKPKKLPEVPLPDGLEPNEAQRGYASQHRLDLVTEFDQFRDHHRARGSVFRDWTAAFWTWLRNAVKYRRPGFGGGSAGSTAAFEAVREAEERARARGEIP